MAAVVLGVEFHNTANGPHSSGAFTPAAGDLLVAVYFGTGTSGVVPTCTSTGNTAAWTNVDSTTFTTAGNNGRIFVWIQNALCTAVSTNVTCGVTDDNTSGGHIIVFRVSGMTKTGATAKLQSSEDNSHAAGTPQAVAMGAAVTTTNPTLGVMHDEGTTVAITPPTNWTERGEGIITVPTSRAEGCSRDSGYTGTTITWGTASTGVYGSYFIELDASAAAAGNPITQHLPFVQAIQHKSPI